MRSASLACALALGVARPAHADPSLWQRAERPELAHNQQLLNRIERLLGTVGLPELNAEFSAGAVALFQLGDARFRCADTPAANSSPLDPRLEYLIGGALVQAEIQRETDARCLLERALRDAPESPLAAQGYVDLSVAAGRLGDHSTERRALLRAIEITWDPDLRANDYSSLAESDMGAGELKLALREYRFALTIANEPVTVALAYYGLAVALDRSGDLPSALQAAKRAISVQLPPTAFSAPNALDLPNVSFSPSYEIQYYKALGAMAAAENAKDDAARREALADAAEHWSAYLVHAESDRTPWVQAAKLHQASVARALSKLGRPPEKPQETPENEELPL